MRCLYKVNRKVRPVISYLFNVAFQRVILKCGNGPGDEANVYISVPGSMGCLNAGRITV